jgi:hypothetical protein
VGVNDFVLVQGMRDTRGALRRWNADPWPVLRVWAGGALMVASAMLFGVWVVASVSPVDLTPLGISGITHDVEAIDIGRILFRNSLVLALHAFACVAGFIAGSSLVLSAEQRTGLSRLIHEKARTVAFAWVALVTGFSLATQTYALGRTGGQLANRLGIAPGTLVLTTLPHAIPELTALFLPLAAWVIASRRNDWQDLLAATFATVAVAVPTLVAAALWEVYVWPHLLAAVSPYA